MLARRFGASPLSRRRLLSLAGAGFALALAGGRRDRAMADAPTVQQVLANGLTVIIDERPSADTVALQHTALAGVRDDGDQPGITVLTSRMLLAGTPRRPSDIDMRSAATLAGGTLTRGTTVEASTIGSVMPASSDELAFDLVSDALVNPLFSTDALKSQRALALQGLAQRRSDPAVLIDDLFQQTLFAGQTLGNAPLGTETSLNALTLDALRTTWQRLWGGANGVVTVTGRIKPDEALDLANRYFGPLFGGAANVRQPTAAQPPASPSSISGTAGQQQQFRVGFLAPSLTDNDRYAVAVLTEIVSGFSGRLLRELRTKRGISYTPSAAFLPFTDAGEWYTTASVDPDKLDEALDVTRTVIQQLGDEGATDAEVSDAVDAISGQQALMTESNAAVARQLAAEQVFGDVSTEEYVRRVQTVRPDDVLRVARSYLDLSHSLTVVVGPQPGSAV